MAVKLLILSDQILIKYQATISLKINIYREGTIIAVIWKIN
jgi:hypothetical protein